MACDDEILNKAKKNELKIPKTVPINGFLLSYVELIIEGSPNVPIMKPTIKPRMHKQDNIGVFFFNKKNVRMILNKGVRDFEI